MEVDKESTKLTSARILAQTYSQGFYFYGVGQKFKLALFHVLLSSRLYDNVYYASNSPLWKSTKWDSMWGMGEN
jgi:hypothetical protein